VSVNASLAHRWNCTPDQSMPEDPSEDPQDSATRPTQITSSSGLKKPDWLVSNFEPVGEWRKDIALPHPDAFLSKCQNLEKREKA
jgi:hypothetical protein